MSPATSTSLSGTIFSSSLLYAIVDSRHDLVQSFLGAHDEGIDGVDSIHDEEQGALRARSRWLLRLGMDWRICPETSSTSPWTSPLRESVFPAKCRWHGSQRDPRHFFPRPDEVRRWSPKEFARHVLLSVGTTIFQGILKSMTKELTTLAPFTMMVTVTASPEWKYLVCIGECFCTHPRVRFECVQSLSRCCTRCLIQFRSSFSLLSSIIETVAGQACTV